MKLGHVATGRISHPPTAAKYGQVLSSEPGKVSAGPALTLSFFLSFFLGMKRKIKVIPLYGKHPMVQNGENSVQLKDLTE